MAIVDITTEADREKIEDRLPAIERLAALAEQTAHLARVVAAKQGILATLTAERDAVGARLRRGAIREKPALAAVLENPLTNAAVELDGNGDIVKLLTNDDVP